MNIQVQCLYSYTGIVKTCLHVLSKIAFQSVLMKFLWWTTNYWLTNLSWCFLYFVFLASYFYVIAVISCSLCGLSVIYTIWGAVVCGKKFSGTCGNHHKAETDGNEYYRCPSGEFPSFCMHNNFYTVLLLQKILQVLLDKRPIWTNAAVDY